MNIIILSLLTLSANSILVRFGDAPVSASYASQKTLPKEPLILSHTDLTEALTGNWFGNYMTKVGYKLFNADQCGVCGETTVTIGAGKGPHRNSKDTGDKLGLLPQLMETWPLTVNAALSSQCENKVQPAQCSAAPQRPAKEDAFPHWDLTKTLFTKHLYPNMKNQSKLAALRESLSDTLVVHLRGTDSMPKTVGGADGYIPAPCQYVKDTIQKNNFKKVQLVTDDTAHVCIKDLEAIKDVTVTYEKRTLVEDFHVLMSAPNIVLSTSSTFGLSGVLMYPEEHKFVAMPLWTGKALCCDGSFDEGRMAEMCKLSKFSNVYAIPFPTSQKAMSAPTADFMLDSANFESTVVHKCD